MMNGAAGYRIFHLDIKPSNLLLFGTRVKIGDFGVCRASQHTITGHSGGLSRPYAPPELFRAEAHERSDQYSLAVSYCHLRGGRLPFLASSADEWMHRHLHGVPDLAMLPEAERPVVAKALSKDPFARWASCREFVANLRAGRQPDAIPEAAFALSSVPTSAPEISPFFTGREAVLDRLDHAFTETSCEGRPHVQVLSGQGGNGKTQIALKYVARHWKEYKAIFWVRCASSDECKGGFVGIARQLGLPEAHEAEQARVVAAALRWLEEHLGWLLVLDNADDPQEVKGFLPRSGTGHILVTSRAQSFDVLGVSPNSVPPFTHQEAIQFLLERTDRKDASSSERGATEELSRELGYLPLALEQAGAYVAAKQARFQDYLATFRKTRLKLLEKMPPVHGDYSNSVATTWRLNFGEVKKKSRAASDLLWLSALLYPDAIPLELLEQGYQHLGPAIARALTKYQDEPVALDELLEPLTRFSLVQRNREARTYSIHLLMQEVLAAGMKRKQRACWAERVVRAMATVFPPADFHNWLLCERLLPHALCCAGHVEKWEVGSQ
jgi:hypothetical protein